jgi:4-carboxymuconolactone decarboxylase
MESERYRRGLDILNQVDAQTGQKVVEGLADIAPDFARLVVEFPFGDIFSRPGLDPRSRQIAAVAALCALGHAAPQLEGHIHGALNLGLSRQEVVEIIMQMAVHAGFPAALGGMQAAKRVFAQRDQEGQNP